MSSSPLQNRIVGSLVVVGLAVIILPEIFSNAGRPQNDEFQVTPLRPVATTNLQSPSFPEDFSVHQEQVDSVVLVPIIDNFERQEVADTVDLSDEVAESVTDNPTAEPNQANHSELNNDAFVIQLGAFSNAEAVERLLGQLRSEGYTAYTRVLRRESGELQLVLVGPDLSEQALTAQIEPLKALTGLDGKVVPYRPANE